MRCFVFASLVLLATPALAQIVPTTPARQRAAERAARREAQHADVPYKDSHLDPAQRPCAERVARVAHEPRFGRDGRPRITAPRPVAPRRPRAAREPKP